MSEELRFESISSMLKSFKVDIPAQEVASWAVQNKISEQGLDAISGMCSLIQDRRNDKIITTLVRMSRLPQKNAKLFSNFDFRDLGTEAVKNLVSLNTLSFLEAKRNVIMIGPPGTGKTHIAQAIGNECCRKGYKTYFIKMGELKDKFAAAIVSQKTGRLLNALAKYTCFIIDEAGYCQFNKEETRLLFQLIDRIDAKQMGSIVITSNKELADWEPLFSDLDALECTLDRIWNNAICIRFSGASYRGKNNTSMYLDFTGGITTNV